MKTIYKALLLALSIAVSVPSCGPVDPDDNQQQGGGQDQGGGQGQGGQDQGGGQGQGGQDQGGQDQGGGQGGGSDQGGGTVNNLQGANCYMICPLAELGFGLLKGTSTDALEGVQSAEVIWETLCTETAPAVGDVVSGLQIKNDSLFVTAGAKEGNALVAVKNEAGTVLWSWHIWVTEYDPETSNHVLQNNAGTIMTRNLGALSNTPQTVSSFGLMYQWGRKDPFMGSAVLKDNTTDQRMASTITWPQPVSSNSSNGTIQYTIENPTTYIVFNRSNYDWYWTGNDNTDHNRWTSSKREKSLYDPCPKGWRIPDGGNGGLWAKLMGASDATMEARNSAWLKYEGGFILAEDGTDAGTIWLPCPGQIQAVNKALRNVGEYGVYGCTDGYNSTNDMTVNYIYMDMWGLSVTPFMKMADNFFGYSDGRSVRCCRDTYTKK